MSLLGITNQTFRKIMAQKKPCELIALYSFYAYRVQEQKTQQIWCTNSFVSKGLGWGIEKVKRVKDRLRKLGLIEDIQSHQKNGKFGKTYILVRFVDRQHDFHASGEKRPSSNQSTNASLGKGSASKGTVKYSHSTSTQADARIRKVDTEDEARIINLYHRILCDTDPSFRPVTKLTDELKKVLEVFADKDDEELTDIFETARDYGDRTLVRILWSTY